MEDARTRIRTHSRSQFLLGSPLLRFLLFSLKIGLTLTTLALALALTVVLLLMPKSFWKEPSFFALYNEIILHKRIENLNFFMKKESLPEITVAPNKETCINCHDQIKQNGLDHPLAGLGCFVCHLGDPSAQDKMLSHKNMISFPGNLDQVDKTCMRCHADIVHRVHQSLMNTQSGMKWVNRIAFGLNPEEHNPSETSHFEQLCRKCHLGNPRTEHQPIGTVMGGGCMACHGRDTRKTHGHFDLSLKIDNQACFDCHSRSSRISLNYEGWHETTLTPQQWSPKNKEAQNEVSQALKRSKQSPLNPQEKELNLLNNQQYRMLSDQRILEKKPQDIHFTRGLLCIDCHTSRETMGTEKKWTHQEDQIEISCEDCHQEQKVQKKIGINALSSEKLSLEDQKILILRNYFVPNREYVLTKKTLQPLTNVFWEGTQIKFLTKNSHQLMNPRSPSPGCLRSGNHERVSCQSCHSAWAPQCIGCHSEQNPQKIWKEWGGTYLADLPTLGWNEKKQKIEPFVPGMIMTLKAQQWHQEKFVRLFAPISPHTTQSSSRSCASCHQDPLALGYGRGKIQFGLSLNESLRFFPLFERQKDHLPADAWIGFMMNYKASPVDENSVQMNHTTRSHLQPLTLWTQKKILRVGFCLQCHQTSDSIFENFTKSLSKYYEDPH